MGILAKNQADKLWTCPLIMEKREVSWVTVISRVKMNEGTAFSMWAYITSGIALKREATDGGIEEEKRPQRGSGGGKGFGEWGM